MDDIEKIAKETLRRVKDRLFRKIPDLEEEWIQLYVSLRDFKRLTDEEFILIWDLGTELLYNSKTEEYVKERRRLLGLDPDHSPSDSK